MKARIRVLLVAASMSLWAIAVARAEEQKPAAGPDDKGTGATAAELIVQGDALYARRSSDKTTYKAIALYRKALKLEPRNYEVQWRLARAFFWLADNTDDGDRDKDLGWKGLYHAREAIALSPSRVEGHFFAALCLGEHAKGLGIVTALRQGIEGRFRGHLDQAMRIDRGYEDGGADRAYGNFWHLLPWPKKDNAKALTHFKKSLGYNPRFPRTHFYLAQVYLDEGEDDLARSHLKKCLAVDPRTGNAMDNYRYQWHCRKLVKEKGF